jgi:opacity protein-like surface antigen
VVGDMLSVNLGYRFRPHRAIQPYVVLGLGAGRIDYRVDVAQGRSPMIDDTVHPLILRWQLGVDLALSARWTISVGYGGVFSDQFTLERADGDRITTTYLAHAMTAGARYQL